MIGYKELNCNRPAIRVKFMKQNSGLRLSGVGIFSDCSCETSYLDPQMFK